MFVELKTSGCTIYSPLPTDRSGPGPAYKAWLAKLEDEAGDALRAALYSSGTDREVAKARAKVLLEQISHRRQETAKYLSGRYSESRVEIREKSSPSVREAYGRSIATGDRLYGYGAVFYTGKPGTEFELGPGIVERISRTAFDRALREHHDVRALVDHNQTLILGRTAAGTLKLSKDENGLRYVADVPDTQAGRDIALNVRIGNVSGSSFAFQVRKQSFVAEQTRDIRIIEDLTLLDVSPVSYPAYSATSVTL